MDAEEISRQQSLAGVTVIVTRPLHQAGLVVSQIESEGGRAEVLPLIEIHYRLDDAVATSLQALPMFDGVIATSANAVRAFAQAGQALLAKGGSPKPKVVYVVGDASRHAAEEIGWKAVAWPDVRTGAELVERLLQTFPVQSGRQHWLLAQGQLADNHLAQKVEAAGHKATTCICYDTVAAPLEDIAAKTSNWQKSRAVAVLLFSPSAVRAFKEHVWQHVSTLSSPMLLACIGETTAAACRELALPVDCVAARPSGLALVDTVVDRVRQLRVSGILKEA